MLRSIVSRARARVAVCAAHDGRDDAGRSDILIPVEPDAPGDHRARLALAVRRACAEHGVDVPLVLVDGLARPRSGSHRAAWLVVAGDRAVLCCSGCGLVVRVGGGL